MRKQIFMFLMLFLASNDIAYGKHDNKKSMQTNTKYKHLNKKLSERPKRSAIKTFYQHTPSDEEIVLQKVIENFKLENIRDDAPFWGTRGRRETSLENSEEIMRSYVKNCPPFKTCYPVASMSKDIQPFWGNRGRRYDSNNDDRSIGIWEDKTRRQEDDDPFWGSRGRRNEEEPFWGSLGRRYKNTLYDDEETPFWANRGRRKLSSLFDESEPFWGNREKKSKNRYQKLDSENTFWDNRDKREHYNDDIVRPVFSELDYDSEVKARLKNPNSFWSNRGRESSLKNLFTGVLRGHAKPIIKGREVSASFHIKPPEQKSVQDNRIYADEPHYIIIERSSRSSMEQDPYIITRGKKYGNLITKTVRDRRGALEDIVKSVQKDPYYIARGKKSSYIKVGKTIIGLDNLNKEKVCGIIQTAISQGGNTMKREINDTERDRRTILKKLAAKLQEDPYFVSRGKKDETNDDDNTIKAFVADIADLCS